MELHVFFCHLLFRWIKYVQICAVWLCGFMDLYWLAIGIDVSRLLKNLQSPVWISTVWGFHQPPVRWLSQYFKMGKIHPTSMDILWMSYQLWISGIPGGFNSTNPPIGMIRVAEIWFYWYQEMWWAQSWTRTTWGWKTAHLRLQITYLSYLS